MNNFEIQPRPLLFTAIFTVWILLGGLQLIGCTSGWNQWATGVVGWFGGIVTTVVAVIAFAVARHRPDRPGS